MSGSQDSMPLVNLKDVQQAYQRISTYIHKTPVFTSNTVNSLTGRQVYFKPENLQKTGSFKIRGALNSVLKLKESNKQVKGVITHSSGNHGQALSFAANLARIPCTVVSPSNAPAVKKAAVQEYGADLVECEPNQTARKETCDRIAEEKQLTFIPPYNFPDVIAGQGTVALELLDQVPDLDAILVPISGGGLLAGISLTTKALKPGVKVFVTEPEGKELEKSLRAGRPLWTEAGTLSTIADGLRVQKPGDITWALFRDLVEKQVFTVNDREIIDAMFFAAERMKLIMEPSGASTLAAVLSDKMEQMDQGMKKIGVVISGGNTDLLNLPWMETRK